MGKTRKQKPAVIFVEEYTYTLFKKRIRYIIIRFKKGLQCYGKTKKVSLFKKLQKKIASVLKPMQNLQLVKRLQLNANDPDVHTKLGEFFNKTKRYTFCLNKNTLIFGEYTEDSFLNIETAFLTKHIILCSGSPCTAGEAIYTDSYIEFDNDSGTYLPTFNSLKKIKRAMPFLKIKLIEYKE